MKKRIAILICLLAVSFSPSPVMGEECNQQDWQLTAGVSRQINEILSIDTTDFYTRWVITSSNVRVQPNINSDIVTTLSFNEEVTIKEYNNEWNCIVVGGENYYIWSELITDTKCESVEYNVPHNKIKSFMSYRCITSKSSDQYKLQQIAYTGQYGIRQVNGRFCIAVGSAYTTQIGQYIDLVLENGSVIPCILADCKADIHTDANNILTSDGSLAEFVVDTPYLSNTIRYTGDISTACDDWESMITKIIIYDKVEEF